MTPRSVVASMGGKARALRYLEGGRGGTRVPLMMRALWCEAKALIYRRELAVTRVSIDLDGPCGARCRDGSACRSPRVLGRRRCRMHGGASTGPTSTEGKARAAEALARVNRERRALAAG